MKTIKQTLTSQEQITHEKEMLLESQNRSLNDIKRNNDLKDKDISNLKNQIEAFSMKITENEKLIEDNKQMIMYLNKTKNDNMTNPFRSRFSGENTINENSNAFSNYNLPNSNFQNNYFNKNNNINSNLQFMNNPNEINKNIYPNENNNFLSSETIQNNNYLQTSGISNSGMPETNFLGIQRNNNKVMINSLSSSGNNNMQNSNHSSKGSERKYNMEEEFPRQMIQPQSIVTKP